jgi:hypothetical protein
MMLTSILVLGVIVLIAACLSIRARRRMKNNPSEMDDLDKAYFYLKIESYLEVIESNHKFVYNLGEVVEFLLDQNITKDLDSESLYKILTNGKFKGERRKIYDRVVMDESLIPSGTPIYIKKKKYKINGEVWIIHKNDVDPFPSSPHAHNYDQNMVMHLGNGDLYNSNREIVGRVKRKKLLDFRSRIDNVELPPLELT